MKRYKITRHSDKVYIIRLTHWLKRFWSGLDENELSEALVEISKSNEIVTVIRLFRFYDRYVVVVK